MPGKGRDIGSGVNGMGKNDELAHLTPPFILLLWVCTLYLSPSPWSHCTGCKMLIEIIEKVDERKRKWEEPTHFFRSAIPNKRRHNIVLNLQKFPVFCNILVS